jgi:hypothetical protein
MRDLLLPRVPPERVEYVWEPFAPAKEFQVESELDKLRVRVWAPAKAMPAGRRRNCS